MVKSRLEKNKKIIKAEEKEKSKEKASFVFKVFLVLFLIFSLSYFSFRYLGNYGLFVREYSKVYERLPSEYHGIKIIQFSDLYYGSSTDNSTVKSLVDKINEIEPEIVVFTGGLIYKDYKIDDSEQSKLIDNLKKINTKVGKYFVSGNSDDETSIDILKNAGFTYLNDTYEKIYYKSTTPIVLNGVVNSMNTDISKESEYFGITLVHEPDKATEIMNSYTPDIILAGESLNGQIRLPIIGGLIKTSGSKTYNKEYYKINNTELYITNGLGSNTYPLRLFNHPSINFFRLRSSDK